MKKLRKNNGITLIALVITIIVLLILAGVTIATLTGENGILTQANKAKTSNTEGEASEQFALLANEWAIEKNTSNKTLGEFLNGKITEGKLSSIEDNGNGTYTIKLNGYQTIIDQNGKTSSVFNPEEWDKTATPEDCFIWGSDTKGEDGYNVIIGYTEKLENYTKAKIPTRCKRIICDGSYYDNQQYSDEQIGRAFFSNIEKIEIPNTVVEIGAYAFGNLHNIKNSLKEIVIPSSVTNIGCSAFYGCTNLSNITIPSSVTSIGNSAFYRCTNLSSITIPSSVTSIENCTFADCTNLSNITIPSSVTSIETSTFANCTNLSNITIPSSVTSIGYSAFYGCTNLSSITIPSSVTSIESNAFVSCTNLSSITISNSVTSMGENVFYNWTSSQIINIQGYSNAPSGWNSAWNSNCSATINWNQ